MPYTAGQKLPLMSATRIKGSFAGLRTIDEPPH